MLDATTIVSAVVDHALATGVFDEVNQHEPLNSPGNGVACAIWPGNIEPAEKQSGLASVSLKFALNVRLYIRWNPDSLDSVDIRLIDAVDTLMRAYSGDFTLGGLVQEVDFFGTNGTKLAVEFGYQSIDNADFRVATITLPLIVIDAWDESE